MAKVRFTAGRVAGFTCTSGKIPSFLWDATQPGLGLRASPGGGKTYIFQGKLRGQVIRLRIGDPATWTIDAAQGEAARLRRIIDAGQDPRQVKADEQAAEQAARTAREAEAAITLEATRRAMVTLGDAWPAYLEYGKTKRNKRTGGIGWSAAHARAHIELAAPGGQRRKRGPGLTTAGPLAVLMSVKLSDLTGQRLAEWLGTETQIRPTAAALAFRLLRAFAGWAADVPAYHGLIPADAFTARKVKDAMPKPETREGDSLQKEQLATWFDEVRKIPNPVVSAYLQGLLLTGARRRELSDLRWADVDFQWCSITLRDKVEGTRTIPLTPYLAQLLAALPRRRDNPWVFSSPTAKDGRIVEPRYAHRDALVRAGLPHVSLHGLRRSFGTLTEWCEAPAGVVAQIQGHKPSALAEKRYRRRPLDLLRMWHVRIEAWMLEQAGIDFVPDTELGKLRVVAGESKG